MTNLVAPVVIAAFCTTGVLLAACIAAAIQNYVELTSPLHEPLAEAADEIEHGEAETRMNRLTAEVVS